MQDVRALIALGVKVCAVLGGITAACAVAYFAVRRGKAALDAAQALKDGMKIGFGALLVLVIALVLFALADFRAAFELFHRIAFTNDNWLLDPRTDRLIRMMPQQLFETLCLQIALGAAALPVLGGMGTRICVSAKTANQKLRKN